MKTYELRNVGVLRKTKEEIRLSIHYVFLQSSYWLSACAVNGFASYYLAAKGFGEGQIGLILAAINILLLISQPFVAQFADQSVRIRIKHIMAASMGMAVFLAGGMLLIPRGSLLFIPIYLLLLVLISMNGVLLTTLSSEHITRGTRLNYGLARGIGSVSFASMSILTGILTKRSGPNITMAAFMVIASIFIVAVLRFQSPEKTRIQQKDTPSLNLTSFVKGHPRFMLTVFATFLMFLSNNMVSTYFFQIIERVGGDSTSFGKAVAVAAYIELLSMAVYPAIKRYLGSHAQVMKLAAVAIFIKTLLILHAGSVGAIYRAQTLQFFGFGLYIPAQVYYVSSIISQHDQAKGQMFLGFSGTLAAVFSCLVGGYLFEHIGIYATIMLTSVLSLVGIFMLFFCVEKDAMEKR